MDIIQLPRFNAKTPEEEIQQIESFLFALVNQLNNNNSEIERQISEVKNK